ncbi:hypothetical protein AURDEDRAFT_161087 [Auricularia subglabra TFB-10046 SS5]|nr:hypothetical protein AURDEDRAFT_161087 [Auricularia subglabra TFB-10046 SS5]
MQQEPYQAPAHKHAHHLHSIPPREKSTRTLILDHLLWMHATARFDARQRDSPAQCDPSAVPYGPQARQTVHRTAHVHPRPPSAAAQESNAKAEGLEKVLCAMLQQPPEGASLAQASLPNGVRLRLALGTLINELFADSQSTGVAHPNLNVNMPPAFDWGGYSTSTLPAPIVPLVHISSYNALSATALSSAVASSPLRPPSIISHYELPSPSVPFNAHGMNYMTSPRATPSTYKVFGRTRHLFQQGAAAGTAQDHRCHRHLIPSCEACGKQLNPVVVSVGSGLMHPQSSTHPFPFRSPKHRRPYTSRLADLIPPFLRLSALVAAELAREALQARDRASETSSSASPGEPDASPRSPVSPLAPSETDADHTELDSRSRTETSGEPELTLQAFPSRNWYALAANLFTLAVLEGYLIRGWRGPDGAEVVLQIGLGQNPDEGNLDGLEASCYDPDGMPSLADAAKALFGGLMDEDSLGISRSAAPTTAEAYAYRDEMNARMSEVIFFSVAPHTPNLATHLDALVAAYPMERMEQLALHYCKAVARWRGKPELETYQKDVSQTTVPPSIHDFFVIRDPAQVSRAQKRKRSMGEMPAPRKRPVIAPEEEDWVGPYGV